jgi:curli biogenesis system outer membrane secretion channel CsgG
VPVYYGPKKRIAVLPFDTLAPGAVYQVGWGLSEMTITALVRTNRFVVVERGDLDAVLAEQSLGQQGYVRPGTEARVGRLLGAQLLLKGAITEFQETQSAGGLGAVLGGVATAMSSSKAKLAIDIRLIDTTTGEIVAAERAEGKTSSTGFGLAGIVGGIPMAGGVGTSKEMEAAARRAIEEVVATVISRAEAVPWAGKIVKVTYNQVYLNAGSNMNMKPGMVLFVFRKGEDLVDPDTGISLGTSNALTGKIQIVSVQDKYAICAVVEGAGHDVGDIVKFTAR